MPTKIYIVVFLLGTCLWLQFSILAVKPFWASTLQCYLIIRTVEKILFRRLINELDEFYGIHILFLLPKWLHWWQVELKNLHREVQESWVCAKVACATNTCNIWLVYVILYSAYSEKKNWTNHAECKEMFLATIYNFCISEY